MSVGQMVLWFGLCFLVGAFPAFMLGQRFRMRDVERRLARHDRRLDDLDDRLTGGTVPPRRLSNLDGSFGSPTFDPKEARATIRLLQRMQRRLGR